MTLDHIAIGHTYQLDAPLLHYPTVIVEAIEVIQVGESPQRAVMWREALIYVYEVQRGLRYPCLPQTLRPVAPTRDATGA
jgi:hypothetical protein